MPPSIFNGEFINAYVGLEAGVRMVDETVAAFRAPIARALRLHLDDVHREIGVFALGTLKVHVETEGYSKPETSVVLSVRGTDLETRREQKGHYVLSLNAMGNPELYPISDEAIPALLEGVDLISLTPCWNMRSRHEFIRLPTIGVVKASAKHSIGNTNVVSTFEPLGAGTFDEQTQTVNTTYLLLSRYSKALP